jgi:hypothetical protein
LLQLPEFLPEIGIERSRVAKRLVSDSDHVHSIWHAARAIHGAIRKPYLRVLGHIYLCAVALFRVFATFVADAP